MVNEMEKQPIIECDNLVKIYKTKDIEVLALQGLELQIDKGELMAIVGNSGSGKSTFLNMIGGLDRPSAGRLIVDGKNLFKLSEKELVEYKRSTVGFVWQNNARNLLPYMTALQNVQVPMMFDSAAKKEQRALELLEMVGLPDKARSYPSQLSGGQKQRIAIARALASDPEVLLCDEATSALDPQTTRDVLRLIQDINKRLGITVIIITHDMSVIEQICHRVAILDAGRVAETGPVEDVFHNPKSKAGRRLVSPNRALPESDWDFPVARVAFNGSMTEEPVIATLAMEKKIAVSILGADTRNVDGKTFGTMLISLPDTVEKRRIVLDYLNSHQGVTAEEVR